MNGELGLRCCYSGCTNEGVVHLFIGQVKASADEATYCGASYCCWAHLAGDAPQLRENFLDVPVVEEAKPGAQEPSEAGE